MQASTPVQIAVAGEALIDLIRNPDGSYQPCLGGALYNLCRALARQAWARSTSTPCPATALAVNWRPSWWQMACIWHSLSRCNK